MTRVITSTQEIACLLTRDSSHDSNSSIHYLQGRPEGEAGGGEDQGAGAQGYEVRNVSPAQNTYHSHDYRVDSWIGY